MMIRLYFFKNLMRRLSYLHPALGLKESYVSSTKADARKLCQILPANDIDKLGDDWRMYQGEGAIKNFWCMEENEDDQDAKKYPTLAKLAKTVLVISHGQANIEWEFLLSNTLLHPEEYILVNHAPMEYVQSKILSP